MDKLLATFSDDDLASVDRTATDGMHKVILHQVINFRAAAGKVWDLGTIVARKMLAKIH